MMVQQVGDILKFLFMTLFTVFIITGVNYEYLFKRKLPAKYNDYNKILLSDCIKSPSEAWQSMPRSLLILVCAALFYWLIRVIIAVFSYFHFREIKKFYNVALGIEDSNLENVTWEEVQQRLMEVQVEQRMCIHKESLTELDIYHRILRFENYFIAMVNKGVIPLRLQIPFVGDTVFLTRGLRYNINFLLFFGIGSPFKNWHLKEEYKRSENRHQLAENLSRRILYLGLINLLLCPFILLFQILRSFYHYTGIIKREPGFLGVRRWSHYGLVSLRHYNELNHELKARLNRGYRCSSQYMNSFNSALAAIIANHVAFVCGAVFAVLVVLTIYDEDVIQVEHILTIMTLLAAVLAACRVLIPNENLVWCPEILMTKILSEVHYLPDSWKGKAHTSFVRKEFSNYFQYKVVHLMESLISPLVTPYVLCFKLRQKSLEMVDFLRNFTVEVTGVGDICSFAQMDIRKHGSRTWHPHLVDVTSSSDPQPNIVITDNGKTELSLLHFTLTNPNWKPPQDSAAFLNAVKTQARKDFVDLPILQENPLFNSMNSITLDGGIGDIENALLTSRWIGNKNLFAESFCGQVNHLEGSRQIPLNGILGSLSQVVHEGESLANNESCPAHYKSAGKDVPNPFLLPVRPQDLKAVDMSVSALYLHELHQRHRNAENYADNPVNVVINPNFQPSTVRERGLLPPTCSESCYNSSDPPSVDDSLNFSSTPRIPPVSNLSTSSHASLVDSQRSCDGNTQPPTTHT